MIIHRVQDPGELKILDSCYILPPLCIWAVSIAQREFQCCFLDDVVHISGWWSCFPLAPYTLPWNLWIEIWYCSSSNLCKISINYYFLVINCVELSGCQTMLMFVRPIERPSSQFEVTFSTMISPEISNRKSLTMTPLHTSLSMRKVSINFPFMNEFYSVIQQLYPISIEYVCDLWNFWFTGNFLILRFFFWFTKILN